MFSWQASIRCPRSTGFSLTLNIQPFKYVLFYFPVLFIIKYVSQRFHLIIKATVVEWRRICQRDKNQQYFGRSCLYSFANPKLHNIFRIVFFAHFGQTTILFILTLWGIYLFYVPFVLKRKVVDLRWKLCIAVKSLHFFIHLSVS